MVELQDQEDGRVALLMDKEELPFAVEALLRVGYGLTPPDGAQAGGAEQPEAQADESDEPEAQADVSEEPEAEADESEEPEEEDLDAEAEEPRRRTRRGRSS